MNKPYTTLFMLMSVDGKISTGDNDSLDFDKDLPKIDGVTEGLYQYYDIEKTTDVFSLNTGRVFEKIGVNEKKVFKNDVPAYFVVVDNKPHLTKEGVEHLSQKTYGVFLVTNNKNHPAIELSKTDEKIKVFLYENEIDFKDVFARLKSEHNAERLTIQSGGNLNAILLKAGLIDRVLLVVTPCIIGGKNTSTVVDGESLHEMRDLSKIKTLELKQAKVLKNNYLLLEYLVKV